MALKNQQAEAEVLTKNATASEGATYAPGSGIRFEDEGKVYWVFEGCWIEAPLNPECGWGRSIDLDAAAPASQEAISRLRELLARGRLIKARRGFLFALEA